MARKGQLRLWGFRSEYAAVPEPIPVEHICALEFYWNARASKVCDQRGELDLVGGWNSKPEWYNVRLYRSDIEGMAADFAAGIEGREAKDTGSDVPKSMQDVIAKWHVENPDMFGWPRERIVRKLEAACGQIVDPKMVTRGRKIAQQKRGDNQRQGGTVPSCPS